jgi:shikimate kinase
MKIFLIGFMGAGKTTAGQALAEALYLPFIDIDQQIELMENQSVSEIFSHSGETYFRQLESKYLQEISTDGVYAAGGGIICDSANRTILPKVADLIIWLNPNWDTIYNRITHSQRPLVLSNDLHQLWELYQKRLPLYKAVADIEYQGSDQNELISLIKKARR